MPQPETGGRRQVRPSPNRQPQRGHRPQGMRFCNRGSQGGRERGGGLRPRRLSGGGRRPDQGNCSQFSRPLQSRHLVSHRKKVRRLPRTAPAIKKITYHISGLLWLLPVASTPHGAGGLGSHPDGAPPAGYCPPCFYRKTILPVNVSLVNIQLILINAGCNGLRPSTIPEENHFPKPGVCGILNDNEPCNLTKQCY